MCCVMGYTGHDLSAAKFKEYLLRTVMRGPDDQRVVEGPFGLMGFGRLAIMGLTPEGMQPFYRGADCVVCNGELYGFRFEKEILKRRGYKFQSDCDCEILLPLYYEYGLDMFRHMDSEFALICTIPARTGSSPPATPSASVRCSTATPSPATRSHLPPRCRT